MPVTITSTLAVKDDDGTVTEIPAITVATANTKAAEAQKWAEGTDAEVSALGGTHSAKVWAENNRNLVTSVPASATSAGTAGQYAYDTDYFYICLTTGTDGSAVWKRAAISTWS